MGASVTQSKGIGRPGGALSRHATCVQIVLAVMDLHVFIALLGLAALALLAAGQAAPAVDPVPVHVDDDRLPD
jgi:hypothetical protein